MTPRSAFRGYQALGENVTRYEGGFTRDHHEGIDLYREAPGLVREALLSSAVPAPVLAVCQHPGSSGPCTSHATLASCRS